MLKKPKVCEEFDKSSVGTKLSGFGHLDLRKQL